MGCVKKKAGRDETEERGGDGASSRNMLCDVRRRLFADSQRRDEPS